MVYAPVLIITLCRYEHFKRCIESLQKNPYAKETEIYIGVDYPAKEDHKQGYQKIQEYIKAGIEGFAAVHVTQQSVNKGWYENFATIQKEAYRKHDRIIYTEDDNEFAENFLEYMDTCLMYFQDDKDVQAICGYTYPFQWINRGSNIVKINTYFPAWGYGIWREKDELMNQSINLKNFEKITRNIRVMSRLYKESPNQFCNCIKGMIEYIPVMIRNGEVVKLDISFSLYTFSAGKYVIFPAISKVRNRGHDGQGENCGELIFNENNLISAKNFVYETQEIDGNERFELLINDELVFEEGNNKLLNNFYYVDIGERMRSIAAYIIYKLLGRKIAVKIFKSKKK